MFSVNGWVFGCWMAAARDEDWCGAAGWVCSVCEWGGE